MSEQERPQRQVLRTHGRTHVTGGSDPIPGLDGIKFNVDNEGGYLSVVTHDEIPGSPFTGMFLADSSGGGISITSEIDGGIFLTAADSGADIVMTINNDGSIVMGPGAGAFTINSVSGVVSFQFASGTKMGFFGATPITKPTVTGSRGGNAALASLLTALANLGLIVDSST